MMVDITSHFYKLLQRRKYFPSKKIRPNEKASVLTDDVFAQVQVKILYFFIFLKTYFWTNAKKISIG
jgi:hypothetical protein